MLSGVQIQVSTNGIDADSTPGPGVILGETVTRTYEVTNLGTEPLSNVTVLDDAGNGIDLLPKQVSRFIAAEDRIDTVYDSNVQCCTSPRPQERCCVMTWRINSS